MNRKLNWVGPVYIMEYIYRKNDMHIVEIKILEKEGEEINDPG